MIKLNEPLTKLYNFVNMKYYRYNDGAHQIGHINDLLNEYDKVEDKINLKPYGDPDIMLVAIICHDIFCGVDRANHHLRGMEWIVEDLDGKLDELGLLLDYEDRRDAGLAIADHRASGDNSFANVHGRLLSALDIGNPDLDSMIKRSLKHGNDAKGVLHHLNDKFGMNGYGWHNPLHTYLYKDEIKMCKEGILNLTVDKIKELR